MVLEGFVVALWGFFVSLVQERFGTFQDLSPRTKQLVNSLFAFVVPVLVQWVAPVWKPEFGNTNEVVTALLTFLVPAALAWSSSQFAHHFDKLFQNLGDFLKG